MELFQSDLIYSSQNLKTNSAKIEQLGLAPREQKKNTSRTVVVRIKYAPFLWQKGDRSVHINHESNVGVLHKDINGQKMQSGKI